MKKVVISLLCVILAVAIIFGFVYYNRHLDTTTDLQISKGKASDLNQTVIQLNQKISSLNDQIHKLESDLDEKKKALGSFQFQITSKDTLVGTLRDQITMTQTETVHLKSAYDNLISELTELKNNKETLPILERSILSTDQELSQVEKELGQLETDYKTEIMTREALKAELSSRGEWVMELQNKLKNSQARISSLESDITKSESEIETLRNQLSDLRSEKSKAESRVGQLQGKYETVLGDLNELNLAKMRITKLEENHRTLENDLSEGKKTREALENRLSLKETDITQLRKQLEDSKTWGTSLEKELGKEQITMEGLENRLSLKETDITQLRKQFEDSKTWGTSLENELGKEQNTREALENKLSLKETDIAQLRKQFEDSKAWTTSLENELGKDKSRLERLQNQHAKLSKEKTLVESKLGQMQTTYDELVIDLKKQIQNQEVTIDTFQKKISVSFVDRILFKTGKATITSEGAKVLRKVGKTLKNVQGKKIRVVGHTDNVAIISKSRYYKYPSNWELSAARAARVIRFFQNESGLDPTTMEAVGRSFYDPIASNKTPKGRAQNRRVNIIIAPTF